MKVRLPEVQAALDAITPPLDLRIPGSMQVPSARPDTAAVVGMAFHQLFNIEVARRGRLPGLPPSMLAKLAIEKLESHPAITLQHIEAARGILVEQQTRGEAHVALRSCPDRKSMRPLAIACLRLSLFEWVGRTLKKSTPIETLLRLPHASEIEEVLSLLELLPVDLALPIGSGPALVSLSPQFGQLSLLAGGADADAIIGNLLVEVKVSTEKRILREWVRQLVGYLLMAANAEPAGGCRVRSGALYMARHGTFAATLSIDDVARHPAAAHALGVICNPAKLRDRLVSRQMP